MKFSLMDEVNIPIKISENNVLKLLYVDNLFIYCEDDFKRKSYLDFLTSDINDNNVMIHRIDCSNKTTSSIIESINKEIDNRYEKLNQTNSRTIVQYNKNVSEKMNFNIYVFDYLESKYINKETLDNLKRIIMLGSCVGISCIFATSNLDLFEDELNMHCLNRVAFKTSSIRSSRLLIEDDSAYKLGDNDYIFAHMEYVKHNYTLNKEEKDG